MLGAEVLWHLSLSTASPREHAALFASLLAGERRLDILCVEGAVIRGRGGSGMFDTAAGKPKKDLVAPSALPP